MRSVLAVVALAVWLLACVATVAAWVHSYWREVAVVDAHDGPYDGYARDTGYLVVNSGRIYLFDGLPAHAPYPGQLDEPSPARWHWSSLQSNGWSIDVVERVGDGAAWGGFAYRTTPAGYGSARRLHAVIVPCWFIAIALAALPLPVLARNVVRRRRLRQTHCTHCGYDLRATPERCPECGLTAQPKPPHNPPMQRTGAAV